MAEPTPVHDPGQVERFRRLAWPHLPGVLRLALILCRNEHDAQDLAQEAMLKAMRSMATFREGTDIKAWLFTILRHAHVDALRRQGRQVPAMSLDADDAPEPADDSPPPSGNLDDRWADPEAMMQSFSDEQMVAALRTLPEEIRWTLLLVDVEQLDHPQAAELMGVPVGTVKSRAFRGRAMLREKLATMHR